MPSPLPAARAHASAHAHAQGPPALNRQNLRPGGERRLRRIEGALAPVGETGADELRRAAADAGHTPASYRRLLLAYGFADPAEVPASRFRHLRAVSSDRALVGAFSGPVGAACPDERAHAITETDPDGLRYRLHLARACDERLHLLAANYADALSRWAYLGREAWSAESADRLRLVTDEMAHRLRQYAHLSGALAAVRTGLADTLTSEGLTRGEGSPGDPSPGDGFGGLEGLEVGKPAM